MNDLQSSTVGYPAFFLRAPKTILITGCAGFIGTNLCLRILKDCPSVNIVGVDNLLTSAAPTIRNDRFQFIHCDIVTESDRLSSLPKIDEIYHLASIASPPKYKKYPIETLNVNVLGTKNMLDLAVMKGAKFLLTSTSEVYGDPLEHPQKESYYGNVNTVGARSCYDESKRCAETYVYEYRRKYRDHSNRGDFKICRIFNTYGPHMDIDDGRVITNIIKRIIENKPIILYGDGTQTRSFCYIDDMIDGLLSLMASGEAGPINLGNPDTEYTMNELVGIFETVIGFKHIKLYEDRTENDPMLRKPDIGEARRLLGFCPKVGLEEGLHKTIVHFAKTSAST
jgi:nucleoside-diphosphate-sugar epimerase